MATVSGVAKFIGTVAGIAALIPGPHQPIAAAIAVAANVTAQLTAKKPPAMSGSVNRITLGANQPKPYLIGETYYGGNRINQEGFGGKVSKVNNPYMVLVDVYSGAGPVAGFVAPYLDFVPVTLNGNAATGYAAKHLYVYHQLGRTPEPAALSTHWVGSQTWGPQHKLSSYAAISWCLRFDEDGKRFAAGVPQTGAVWRGVLCYDPRKDSTYPGGSGPHRWADPTDTAAFAAAKATWEWSRCPGLHGLRYALGTWERDEANPDARYRKTFGPGIPIDGIRVADFAALANVCDANGWKVDGVIHEPGNRDDNMKNILAAGGAERCWIGGKLGLKLSAPRVALDTITEYDLATDEVEVGAMQGWESRLNTIVPKYRSADHKWEYVPSTAVTIATYLTEDGEEKAEERQYNLVQSKDQAAQLAAYELLDARELGEIVVTCKPRLRRYGAGDLLIVHLPDDGLVNQPCVVLKRTVDPVNMTVELILRGETAAKHDFALGRTGTAPPTPRLVAGDVLDDVAIDVPLPWGAVVGDGRPVDYADVTGENTSKDTNAVGGRPADALLARVDQINDVTIPAVNLAVATANQRIDAARQESNQAAADANARIDAADRVLDHAVRDFAAEVDRAQGADEALSRRIDSIVAESGGYDDRDIRAIIATEQTVRADDDRALGRRVDIVSASVIDGDDAVRAGVKITTDALARSDEAFAQRAEVIEASLGTVDNRILAKAQEITTAYVDADRALTQRIDSIVAEGGYDDTNLRAEISRVDTTAIDRDAAVGRRVDTVEATFSTGGGNMVPNSDLDTTDGWATGIHAPGGPLDPAPYMGLNAAGDPYHPPGENVLSFVQYGPPNTADESAYLDWGSRTFPITAGEYVQFSALVNCHRARVMVILAFRNAAGNFLSAIHSPFTGPVNAGGTALSDYARAGIVAARVPDGAVSAYLILRKYDTQAGQTDSYAWFLRPYVGAAREGQTAWNPYSVGRASPVLLGTVARVKETTDALARADTAFAERALLIEASLGTVDARIGAKAEEVTRAYADADRALASRATTLEAAASAVSTSIVFNDNFNYWPDGAILPARWSVWIAGGNFRTNRLSPGRGGGQYCVQTLNDNADVESGFVQTVYSAGAGKWVIEVTADFDGSGARGAGVTISGGWNIDFCSDPDVNGVVGDRANVVRSWTKMVDLDGSDQFNVHAMHGWSGFGRGMAPKYMVWHRVALRPATDGEIKAGKADATLNAPGGVLARIATTENTLADLPNRYAAATRTATLEAQLRGEAASSLGNTIGAVNGRIDETSNILSARIEDRATAIADAKAGAVAQTVQTLRSEYNGTAATVQQQAATLAAADGRTSVYWEVVGATGDGSTRVRLSKSDGQRGVFYVDADMIVDGTLLVNGSIITDKIANQAVTSSVAVSGGSEEASNGEVRIAQSAALNASGLGYTRVDIQYETSVSAGTSAGGAEMYLNRTQNGQTVRVGNPITVSTASARAPYSFWFLDNPAAGPVTYDLVLSTSSGTRIYYVFRASIAVSEFKK
ncbi:hypothetical protein [Sphingomonas sp. Leaf67]|uniref:hypothetical protein n=1 Tax=Sphingomonas sp. Leaf67 TaxID=1736230 RepID=UPI0012E2E4D2|nr:hypothetical protein [Sphingomonas sp. Leaf67]